MRIGADGLVLPVDENPEANVVHRNGKVVCDARLEETVRLLLQDTEGGQVRRWPVLLVERCKVEALVLCKVIICDDLMGVRILEQWELQ